VHSCVPSDEIPSGEPCLLQLSNSFYAPATFDYTEELSLEIRNLDPLNNCTGFITTMICIFRFPACNPSTGKTLPICTSICDSVDSIAKQCLLEYFGNNTEFPVVNQLLSAFRCHEPQTYINFPLQYIETDDPDDCSEFGE